MSGHISPKVALGAVHLPYPAFTELFQGAPRLLDSILPTILEVYSLLRQEFTARPEAVGWAHSRCHYRKHDCLESKATTL